ncbi:MAG: SOS response-associated peptidase [Steroidobacteraceae bacterium]
MCERFVRDASWPEIWSAWHLSGPMPSAELGADYNVAQGREVAVVRSEQSEMAGGAMRWGLVPSFAMGTPPRRKSATARMETLDSQPLHRGPWKRAQRCLIPANGYYQWCALPEIRGRQPFYVHCTDQDVFAFAGLWTGSTKPNGEVVHSCAIITMTAEAELLELGHRMPAILAADDHAAWLQGSSDAARATLRPYPDRNVKWWPVTKDVSNPCNNAPQLAEPL